MCSCKYIFVQLKVHDLVDIFREYSSDFELSCQLSVSQSAEQKR